MTRGWRGLTGGGGFARIDVADNDYVDVKLILTAEQEWSANGSLRSATASR